VTADLPVCKGVYLHGTEPKVHPISFGGWVNVHLAKTYIFQKEGLLVAWQVYNIHASSSYYVAVFRPVPGTTLTFDVVHSTEVVNPSSGNMTVIVAKPFKVGAYY
jgi:hypothetical protein